MDIKDTYHGRLCRYGTRLGIYDKRLGFLRLSFRSFKQYKLFNCCAVDLPVTLYPKENESSISE